MTSESATGSALWEKCSRVHSDESELVLLCITDGLSAAYENTTTQFFMWIMILCGASIFLMQLGFAMLCAGCVRRKNLINTLLKNLLDTCGAAVTFYCVGYAFAFGHPPSSDDDGSGSESGTDDLTFVGTYNFFLMGGNVNLAFWFFQFSFSAACATIIAGTLAERCLITGYVCYSIFMPGFVYPVIAHSMWSHQGFLSPSSAQPFLGVGALDFAGAGVVHLTGGVTALVATCILGARKGRFFDSNGDPVKPRVIPGHSIAMQVIGVFILWFGWFSFNAGSALLLNNASNVGAIAALSAVNTAMAGAGGAIAGLLGHMYTVNAKDDEIAFDLSKTMNGSLTALAAITGGAGIVEPWAALLIGMVAGVLYLVSSDLLVRYRIDDAVDCIPVHCGGGAWGLLSVGLLASPDRLLAAYGTAPHVGLFYSFSATIDFTLLAAQCTAIIFIIGWAVALMTPFFLVINRLGWFRANELEEIAGLDARYSHGIQEDHEEVKEMIIKEFKRHRQEQQQNTSSRNQRSSKQSSSLESLSSKEESSRGRPHNAGYNPALATVTEGKREVMLDFDSSSSSSSSSSSLISSSESE